MQKEMGALLAKDATEPLTGSAAFYPDVFVVPKYFCGLRLS